MLDKCLEYKLNELCQLNKNTDITTKIYIKEGYYTMNNEQKSNVVPIKKGEPAIKRNPRKRLTLTTPDRVRTYIQGLMIAVENDTMTESKARLLTNQAEAIMKAINAKETEKNQILLEMRLIELEEKEK